MRIGLTVTQDFEGKKIGDQITDAAEVQRIVASEQQDKVVKVNLSEPEKKASVATPKSDS